MSAIAILIDQHTDEGDGIIVQPPVFFEFRLVIRKNSRKLVKNPLKLVDGKYRMDFDDLQEKAADPRNKILILCNPHNPVGRVWTEEELMLLDEICGRHDVLVISDEIHGDIVETPLEDGPWGARGVGEHVMVPTAPAIANAIHDALGIRFSDLPLSAEKIFLALQGKEMNDATLGRD